MAIGGAFRRLERELKRGINRDAYAMTRRATLNIVNDLQTKGPYWDGLFYNAWEVKAGDVTIPADRDGVMQRSEKAQSKPTSGAFTLSDKSTMELLVASRALSNVKNLKLPRRFAITAASLRSLTALGCRGGRSPG